MFAKFAFAVAAASIAASSASATIVNTDSLANYNVANAVPVLLAAGSYTVTPVVGAFTAFNRFSTVSGCDGFGEHCATGWEHSYFITINGVTTGYGQGNGNGGIGPIVPGNAYYATAAQAYAAASGASFTLASATTVGFSIFDDFIPDNSGGISLDVSATVPEPATWALLVGGFAMVGFASRQRRTVAA